MVWKIIERACLILGALFAGVCAYYTMAGYYGRNNPVTPTAPTAATGAAMTPPWWLYSLGILGIALLITGWTMILQRWRENRHLPKHSNSSAEIAIATPSATPSHLFSKDIPDLRVADSDLALVLFSSKERDKLLPLLEAGKLSSWARPMHGNELGKDPPPVILKGEVWRSHYLQSFPKTEGQFRTQTFLKTKSRHESAYFDVLLNKSQIKAIWPDQIRFVEAATRLYEAAEAENVLDFIVPRADPAEKKLLHLKLSLMIDDRIQLLGTRPPSTKPRLIPNAELVDNLYPAPGNINQINDQISDEPVFINVTVRHATLIPVIEAYIAEAKGHAK
jgi:hypothetical protein